MLIHADNAEGKWARVTVYAVPVAVSGITLNALV